MFSVNFPISPKKFPFFYGWVIVGAGTLGIVSSVPGQTMGVGPFTESLMNDVGLSRMQISMTYTIGTICSGLLLIQAGRMIDRLGVRRMMVIATTMFGLTLVFIASSGVVTEFLAGFVGEDARTVVAVSIMFLSFFLLRFWGQGLLAMTPRVMIGKWFVRRRGLAIGIAGVFISFGFGTSPRFLNELVKWLGWRETYYFLALFVGVVVGTVAWVFFREQPEDCGLEKDGGPLEGDVALAPNPEFVARRDYTLREVWRSYPFWVFTMGLGTQGLVVTGVSFHIVSVSEMAGITGDQGLALFVPMALVIVCTNLTAGWLSDKTKLKYLLIFMMGTQAIGTVGLLAFGEVFGRALFVLGFGMSGGMFGTLIGTTWPRFYGLTHLGAITGLNMSLLVLSTSVGPVLFAGSLALLDGYWAGLVVCVVMPLLVLVAAIRADNPQLREKSVE